MPPGYPPAAVGRLVKQRGEVSLSGVAVDLLEFLDASRRGNLSAAVALVCPGGRLQSVAETRSAEGVWAWLAGIRATVESAADECLARLANECHIRGVSANDRMELARAIELTDLRPSAQTPAVDRERQRMYASLRAIEAAPPRFGRERSAR
jgi:hypothetical protein